MEDRLEAYKAKQNEKSRQRREKRVKRRQEAIDEWTKI